MSVEPDDSQRRRVLSPLLDTATFQPLSALVRAAFAARTHAGRLSRSNEDHYLVLRLGRHQETLLSSLSDRDLPGRFDEYGYAALIADGLGGAGALASRVALSTLAHLALHVGRWNLRVDDKIATEIIERLEWFYRGVNAIMVQRASAQESLAGMSTTLTATFSAGDEMFIAHVGHSRAYLYRDGDLTQMTNDQTLERLRNAAPGPAPVDKTTEDLGHLLTETIGGHLDGPQVEIARLRLWDGDLILLCTNGLTDVVPDARIADVLALRRELNEQSRTLVDLALEAGAADNVSVVLAEYSIPKNLDT